MTAGLAARAGALNRWDVWLVRTVWVALAAIVVLSFAQSGQVAAGHAYFHAIFALVGAIPAAILAAKAGGAAWARIAIVGLELLAITQLVEAVGAWGFGPDNDTVVSEVKALHDLGVVLSPVGLIGAVAGVAIGVAAWLRARGRSMIAVAASGGVAVVGLVVVAKLIGF
jgi:hypothetical protein